MELKEFYEETIPPIRLIALWKVPVYNSPDADKNLELEILPKDSIVRLLDLDIRHGGTVWMKIDQGWVELISEHIVKLFRYPTGPTHAKE